MCVTLVGDGDWIKKYIGGIWGEKPLLPLCVDCVDGIGKKASSWHVGVVVGASGVGRRASGEAWHCLHAILSEKKKVDDSRHRTKVF